MEIEADPSSSRASRRSADKEKGKTVRRIAKRRSIERTEDIVRSYNETKNEAERETLFSWLSCYHEAFTTQTSENLNVKTFKEYAQLAEIRQEASATEEIKTFYRKIIGGLGEAIPVRDLVKANTCAEIVLHILRNIDPQVLSNATTELKSLAEKFMDCLQDFRQFTKKEFDENRHILQALHRTLVLCCAMRAITFLSEDQSKMTEEFTRKWHQTKKLCSRHYPAKYLLKLIEQAIQRLNIEDEDSECEKMLKFFLKTMFHAIEFTCRVLKLIRGDCDVGACTASLRRLTDDSRQVRQEQWYNQVLQFGEHAKKAINDSENMLEPLKEAYEETIQDERQIYRNRREECKAFRYGLISKLHSIAEYSDTQSVLEFVFETLLKLIKNPTARDGWIRDLDILEAVLNAFHAVYRQEKFRDEIRRELEALFETLKKETRYFNAMKTWIGNRSMEDKLESQPQLQEEAGENLFHQVRRKVGLKLTIQEMKENTEKLRERYMGEKFREVSSLFEQQLKKHVDQFEFHTVLYQPETNRQGQAGDLNVDTPEDATDEDHTSVYYTRKQQARKTISLKELFRDRSLDPSTPAKEIRKLLLFGNPGTGKTCISRFIAYQWAIGKYEGEFDVVYILLVRELTGELFDNKRGVQQIRTLESALSHSPLVGCVDDELVEGLQAQIDDDLDEPKTLLIMDGLDEGDECGAEMVSQAYSRACKVMLTSRPYDLRVVRQHVHLEVECRGLDDEQLHRFVDKELPTDDGPELISMLTANPNIWEIAHVPVTVNIICYLWREGSDRFKRENVTKSLWRLYSYMVQHVWDRFIEKKQEYRRASKNKVYKNLSKIAFKALRQGKILIEKQDIENVSDTSDETRIIQQTGFLLLQLEGTRYQFPHLTFQEYFAGRFLASAIMGMSDETQQDVEDVLDFITESKYMQRRKVTISFMAEKIFEEATKFATPFRTVSADLDKEPLDLIGLHHLWAKLRLLEATFTSDRDSVLSEMEKHPDVEKLIKPIALLIEEYQNDRVMRDVLFRNLKDVPNLLKNFTELVEPVTKAIEENPKQELQIFLQAAEIIKYVPEHMDRVTKALKNNAENKEDARIQAMSMAKAAGIIGMAPQSAEHLMAILQMGFSDEKPIVRGAAIEQVAVVIVARPQTRSDLLEKAKEAAKDAHHYPRAYAVRQISAMMEASFEQRSDLLEILENGAKDGHKDVRTAAMSQITEVLDLVPERQSLLYELLIRGIEDNDSSVREIAIAQAARFACLQKEHANDLLEKIEQTFNDVAAVRAAALHSISGIALALQGANKRVRRVIYNGIRDKRENVRKAAIKQFPNFKKAAPEEYKYLMKLVKDRVKDRYDYRLLKATQNGAQADEAETREKLLRSLHSDSGDNDAATRQCAEDMLRRMELNKLVEVFWDHRIQRIGQEIALRLLDVAVSMTDGENGQKKLKAITQFGEAIVCERPKEDIDELLSLVAEILESTYPNMLELGKLRRFKNA